MKEKTEAWSSMDVAVRPATPLDVPSCVHLSYLKRKSYESAQPLFWKSAGEGANKLQQKWFEELLRSSDSVFLVACNRDTKVIGFVIAQLKAPPEVYSPPGLTCLIDDFCVENQEWDRIGRPLMAHLRIAVSKLGAGQWLLVSGAHDTAKNAFLQSLPLSPASFWFTGPV
jgi:hypothetical protein